MPGNERLVTQADIKSQVPSGLPAVLGIDTIEVRAGVEELARRLRKFISVSQQETGNRIACVVCIERKVTGLPIQVVHIDLAYLAVKTERDIVVAVHNMDIVNQGVIGPAEKGLRIGANTEVTRRRDRIDLLERGLPSVPTPNRPRRCYPEVGRGCRSQADK